ncbi:MAG: TfoX/Sxy family protein [Gammaproteobacteria bacterium]
MAAMPDELAALFGLGPKSAQWLREAGIRCSDDLRQLGSVAAYVKVKSTGRPVSLNLLWALESALTGEPWQQVARNSRASLLLALEQFERGG